MESKSFFTSRLLPTCADPTVAAIMLIFLGVILFGTVFGLPWIYKASSHAPMKSTLHQVSKRARAWAYLFNGPGIIREEFHKSGGAPFEVLAPDARMIFVSSPKHIQELNNAPDATISLNGAAKHMLQPVYTMNGFNWFDRRGVEGVGFVRTLRTLLTNNIPQLLPDLGVLTRTRWAQLLTDKARVNDSGSFIAPMYPMMMNLVVLLNARSLFGEDLIKNDTFMVSALAYVEETLINAEIVKLVPKFVAPWVGGALSYCLNSHKTFFSCLIPMTEQRIKDTELRRLNHSVPQRADCIQWIIDTAPKQAPWSAERVIYELMAIWFGSVHILSTTIVYVMHDLCLHPEYIEPLRRELAMSYDEFQRTGQGLPLLDSFIKESARLTPVESMSVRRCALEPFNLSDGTKLAVGDWACAPSAVINTSSEHYPSPDSFSGFRFVHPSLLPKDISESSPSNNAHQLNPSKLTDVDHSWLMWGTGRMACPGRHYAASFMKVIVAQLLMNYDFTLVQPDAPRWISWRVAKIPRPWTKVEFTPRER